MTTQTRRTLFRLAPGCCVACGDDLGRAIEQVPGIRSVQALPAANAVLIEHDEKATIDALIRQAASRAVYLIAADAQARGEDTRPPWYRERTLLALVAAGVLLVLGLGLEKLTDLEGFATAVYLATLIVGGFYPLQKRHSRATAPASHHHDPLGRCRGGRSRPWRVRRGRVARGGLFAR